MEIKYTKITNLPIDDHFYQKLYDVISEHFMLDEIFDYDGNPIADEFLNCFSSNIYYCLDLIFDTHADACRLSRIPSEYYSLTSKSIFEIRSGFQKYIENMHR